MSEFKTPKFVGPEWGKAMRGVHGEDGKPCELCGQPATSVAMAGVPTPGGLSYEGQIRLCDVCTDKMLDGEVPPALELIEARDKKAKEEQTP